VIEVPEKTTEAAEVQIGVAAPKTTASAAKPAAAR